MGVDSFGLTYTSISITTQVQEMHGSNPYVQVSVQLFQKTSDTTWDIEAFTTQLQVQYYECYP